jgi:formate C-acetyltransferase
MHPRLAAFQAQAYERGFGPHRSPREDNWSRAFFALYGNLPLSERQARSFAYALEQEPVHVHPLSRIAGQIYQRWPSAGRLEFDGSREHPAWRDFNARNSVRARMDQADPGEGSEIKHFDLDGKPGHVCWDFGRMLELGVSGMIDLCQQGLQTSNDAKARDFYSCVEIVLNGLRAWTQRHVDTLRDAASQEGKPGRRRELEEMAAICQRVPELPATSFREAVQSFWFQHLAVMFENPFGGNGPGRLDYYLWPYLRNDLERGIITLDQAHELITELFIKLHERIAPIDDWVEAIPVGGRHRDGASAINPLSYMMIEVISELHQTHPSVYVRLHDDAPEEFVDLTVRYLIEGGNRAQVFGDDNIIASLHADGVALEDARHWTAGGCMEVSPQGCNCDLVFAFAQNVPLTLELVLNGGCSLQTGERLIPHSRMLADYRSFEELYGAFEDLLRWELSMRLKWVDVWLESYARYRPSFLLSSMTHDCMERGRTINDGGARYTDYGASGVGIPNVGDSLYAIKRTVFDEKRFTGREVLEALRADFVGYLHVRAALRRVPKYGAEDAEADRMVDRVLTTFSDCLKSHRTPYGGHCRPVILGFVWVVSYGQQVGATPDGRGAGRPLAHGLSPQSGAAVKGITAAINSATGLSLNHVSGGGAMMWDLDPSWATADVVKSLLKTFIGQGGHIFQGNIVTADRLIAAQRNPQEHRDLMVRVAGYSARFAELPRATQDEIIARHKYRAPA